MHIIRDKNGITIKRTGKSEDYVRIGVTRTSYFIAGITRNMTDNHKPHDNFTISEMYALLQDLERVRACTLVRA